MDQGEATEILPLVIVDGFVKEVFKYFESIIKGMGILTRMLPTIIVQDRRNGDLHLKLCVIKRCHQNIKRNSTE